MRKTILVAIFVVISSFIIITTPILTYVKVIPASPVLSPNDYEGLLEILNHCDSSIKGFAVTAIGLNLETSTHYIDNNFCEWKIKSEMTEHEWERSFISNESPYNSPN